MLMPSIALPTGPYDWSETTSPRAMHEQRLARLRDLMRARGLSHAIVYGNTFDHEALAWFSSFTPKLGPALLLVSPDGVVKLRFSGGPGMKPSAARLTFVEDVAALRGLDKDVAAWLDGAASQRVGIVCGASILQGDFDALQRVAGGSLTELEAEAAAMDSLASVRESAKLLQRVADHLCKHGAEGVDVRALALDAERLAYAHGAQDVRMRIARKPWGAPVAPPDSAAPLMTPAPVALAIRLNGYWAYADFVLGAETHAALEVSTTFRAYANRVAFPEPPFAREGLLQSYATVNGATVSAPCFVSQGRREWLFSRAGC
jgi:hypothetical protein